MPSLRSALPQPVGGVGHGVEDLHVAAAAAQVAGQVLARGLASGSGCSSRSAFVVRMKPGVQYEHWNAVWSTNACWIGCRLAVRALDPLDRQRSRRPRRAAPGAGSSSTGRPSSSTVHAPHIPIPQPSRGPVSPTSFRSTSRRVWWGADVERACPARSASAERQLRPPPGLCGHARLLACVERHREPPVGAGAGLPGRPRARSRARAGRAGPSRA